jgi:DNA polymerase-3 subunit delta
LKLYSNQLETHLSQEFKACYLIVGDEPLQLKEAGDAIRNKAKSLGFLEREVLHVDNKFSWDSLQASLGTMSLFAEKKIIELNMPTGKAGAAGSKAISNFVEAIPDDICLLIICEQWTVANDKTKWVKNIESLGAFLRVYMPKPNEFVTWLRNRCRKIGLNVEHDTLSLLALRLEGNLLAADQELEKLKMRFNNQVISVKQVAGLVADSARFDVFRLTDSLLENDLKRVIRMLRSLKQNNVALVIIHWALEKEIRTLLNFAYIRDQGARIGPADYRKFGIWQNRQALIQASLNRLSSRKLEDLLLGLAHLDRVIKGQAAGDGWLVMEQWLLNFCSK